MLIFDFKMSFLFINLGEGKMHASFPPKSQSVGIHPLEEEKWTL